jgi:hypothetical protein
VKEWRSEQWFTERVRRLIGTSELEKDTALAVARDITLAGELVTGGHCRWVARHTVPYTLAYNPEAVWEFHLTMVSEEPDAPCQHEMGSTTTTLGVEYRLSRCPRCLSGCIGRVIDPTLTGPWQLGCCSEVD